MSKQENIKIRGVKKGSDGGLGLNFTIVIGLGDDVLFGVEFWNRWGFSLCDLVKLGDVIRVELVLPHISSEFNESFCHLVFFLESYLIIMSEI